MRRLYIVSAVMATALLSACNSASKVDEGIAPPPTISQSQFDEQGNYTVEKGWTSPHPGVYLKVTRDSGGNVVRDQYATTTEEGLAWLSDSNQQKILNLTKGESAQSLNSDDSIRLSQQIRTLRGPTNMVKVGNTASTSNLSAQAVCTATGSASPTSPTQGAKASARAGYCQPTSWDVTAQATNSAGQSPIDSDNYYQNSTTLSNSRVVYIYGIRNCYSNYNAKSGTVSQGNSNYSCS